MPREDAKAVEKYSRRERRTATPRLLKKARAAQIATQGLPTKAAKKSGKQKRKESRRLVLPREDAKAVEKYSRRGRQTADGGRRQEGSCCAEGYSRTPSTWLPRLSTSTVGENGGQQTADENGDKKARAAQRAAQ